MSLHSRQIKDVDKRDGEKLNEREKNNERERKCEKKRDRERGREREKSERARLELVE